MRVRMDHFGGRMGSRTRTPGHQPRTVLDECTGQNPALARCHRPGLQSADTRPLTLSKKSKVTDENADPDAPARAGKGKGTLKPLKLARNETTKERALLRKQEVLPDVVVRPPSGAENGYYGYA